MQIPHRYGQRLRWLVSAGLIFGLNMPILAQNDPAAAESSASSAASSAPPEKPIYANNLERDNDLIAKALASVSKADEVQWLEMPDEKILSLYKTGERPTTKGVLLILHALQTPPVWPLELETLRRNLPLYGWGTMAVPLPAHYPSSIPARESSSAAASSAASDGAAPAPNAAPASAESSAASSAASSEPAKPLPPRDQVIASRTQTAVALLNKLGQFNLVVMVDNSSAPFVLSDLYKKINAASTTSDTIDGPLQALILINLQTQEPLNKAELAAIFSIKDLPVLDVFFTPESATLVETRRLHKAEAMRQNLKDYQQYLLNTETTAQLPDTQSFWLGKIHGFLERKAAGSEITNGGAATSKNIDMK